LHQLIPDEFVKIREPSSTYSGEANMAHPKPTLKKDESIADLLIVSVLVFTILSCLVLIGIF
jgi:hypothetical protein